MRFLAKYLIITFFFLYLAYNIKIAVMKWLAKKKPISQIFLYFFLKDCSNEIHIRRGSSVEKFMKKTLRIIGIGVWYLSSLNYFFFQFQNVLWYQRFLCAFFIWLALNFTFYSWLISPIFCSFLCINGILLP